MLISWYLRWYGYFDHSNNFGIHSICFRCTDSINQLSTLNKSWYDIIGNVPHSLYTQSVSTNIFFIQDSLSRHFSIHLLRTFCMVAYLFIYFSIYSKTFFLRSWYSWCLSSDNFLFSSNNLLFFLCKSRLEYIRIHTIIRIDRLSIDSIVIIIIW